jgi:SulP family sulfate permease
VVPVTEEYIRDGRAHILQDKQVPTYVSILRIHGPFLFGTTEKLAEVSADLTAFPPVVIVRLRNMTAIDTTGLHALETFAKRLHKSGRTLLLCGARHQPAQMLHRADFVQHIGRENILPHVEAALRRAGEIHALVVNDTSGRPENR